MLKQQEYLALPYPQAIQKIDELKNALNEKARIYFAEYEGVIKESGSLFPVSGQMMADVDIERIEKCDFLFTMIAGLCSPLFFSNDAIAGTELNALRAGVYVLIRYHSEKEIPKKLPFRSPKDLFTDKPFEIMKTKEGFKLKSGCDDLWGGTRVHEFEFKLPKE